MISIQEFPPKLPIQIFRIAFAAPFFVFVAFSLEPPKTKLRYFSLIVIIIYLFALPIVYRGEYEEIEITPITALALGWGFKMMIWIKRCLYIEKEKQIGPFILTLFFWRTLPNVNRKIKKEDSKLTIKEINLNIIQRVALFFLKWGLYETFFRWLTYNVPDLPKETYPVRIFNWFTKGIPALNQFLLLYYAASTLVVILLLSLGYDSFLVINGLLLRFVITLNNDKGTLFFDKQQIKNIKEWSISMAYDTKHMFMYPYFSTSPRDLWSTRWQLFLKESFKELAYLPARNLFINKSKRFSELIGVLAAFAMSAILHEYLLLVALNIYSGEHLFFFMLHGIILVIWEGITRSTREKDSKKSFLESILQTSIMMIIILFTLPAFVEPIVRHPRWLISSAFTSYKRDPTLDFHYS
ncbi:13972_t:CDS:1 [Funneliformis geosporum]|uniref:11905_t:CDS:1 n=1 Tax=Funneliformis geosporum TaxID=1117311 RepID=A0A9W4SN44_9GLOM|nr:13972_t:CDS:1 [Funneliformis geosporum]CAI2176253.1 11905_t:CDS:1 [Funneliformis geosporum]